jgi:MerR family mercuric resistance operon transcriptional regulator
MRAKPLTIGQVARLAGVGVETVRFYERSGLLKQPERKASGYRKYGDDVIARLRFVAAAKDLGFSLKEIKELLDLRVGPDATCSDVRDKAQAKIAEVEEKISTLQRMKKSLVEITKACRGRGPVSACPILDALDRESNPKSARTRIGPEKKR